MWKDPGRIPFSTRGCHENHLELKDGMLRAFKDGKEVPMYPGKTWVNEIPTVPSVADHLNFS